MNLSKMQPEEKALIILKKYCKLFYVHDLELISTLIDNNLVVMLLQYEDGTKATYYVDTDDCIVYSYDYEYGFQDVLTEDLTILTDEIFKEAITQWFKFQEDYRQKAGEEQ